MSPIRISLELS